MKYLRGIMDYDILYSGFSVVLEGYNNVIWISDSNEIKSASGYIFILGGGAVSWKSSKQSFITRSTMKLEFIALELVGNEDVWLRNFFN